MTKNMKVVINTCFGGFSLSEKALKLYCESGGDEKEILCAGRNINRHDHLLINVVEKLGSEAAGRCAQLEIINIPDKYSTCYRINEYDGLEDVAYDFQKLIAEKLSSYNIKSLGLGECHDLLQELSDLVQNDE